MVGVACNIHRESSSSVALELDSRRLSRSPGDTFALGTCHFMHYHDEIACPHHLESHIAMAMSGYATESRSKARPCGVPVFFLSNSRCFVFIFNTHIDLVGVNNQLPCLHRSVLYQMMPIARTSTRVQCPKHGFQPSRFHLDFPFHDPVWNFLQDWNVTEQKFQKVPNFGTRFQISSASVLDLKFLLIPTPQTSQHYLFPPNPVTSSALACDMELHFPSRVVARPVCAVLEWHCTATQGPRI